MWCLPGCGLVSHVGSDHQLVFHAEYAGYRVRLDVGDLPINLIQDDSGQFDISVLDDDLPQMPCDIAGAPHHPELGLLFQASSRVSGCQSFGDARGNKLVKEYESWL